jgi:Rad3-related DNA helicase
MLYRGCPYSTARQEASKAQLALTNYGLHLALARGDEGFGPRGILVLDEAHDAAEWLSSAMRVSLKGEEWNTAEWPTGEVAWSVAGWSAWAYKQLPALVAELKLEEAGSEEARKLKRLVQDLTRLSTIGQGERWVWYLTERGVELEPVWPAPYAEKYLFQGIQKVVLSSATLRPQALKYLGLEAPAFEFISALSPFPAARRPIYHVKTARLKWGMSDFDLQVWLQRIDEVIEGRQDRKGIIHAVSYDRAKQIKTQSRYGASMILPARGRLREDVARFKSMRPPVILISPAVHTGYDFPMDLARYQIIAKVPFLPPSALLEIRSSDDKVYREWTAAAAITQMCGRVVRSADDCGETFILDDSVSWLMAKQELWPGWLREAYRGKLTKVPPAMVIR